MDLETAEKYSRMIGDTTVVQVSTSGKKEDKTQSENLKGHPLILASDLMKLETNKAIILYAKENAFQANLIPWYQISKAEKQFKIANKELKLINFQKDYYYDIKNKAGI